MRDYLTYLRGRKQTENTIYLRGYQLRRVSQAFRSRSPWSLTTLEIEGFLASISYMAKTTVRSIFTALRGFYRWASRRGFVREDPTLPIEAPEWNFGVPRPAPDRAIDEAIRRAPERTQWMIYLGAFLGLRRMEIAKVHTDDLVWRDDRYQLRVIGKGGKERYIPVSGVCLSFLKNAQDTDPGWLFPSWHRGQVNSDGKAITAPLRPARVGELIREAMPPGVTPHMLRHRFASKMYAKNGHDIRAVQEALGHSSVETTQIYTAVPKDDLARGVDAASELDL